MAALGPMLAASFVPSGENAKAETGEGPLLWTVELAFFPQPGVATNRMAARTQARTEYRVPSTEYRALSTDN
jgi:hypothetical protein